MPLSHSKLDQDQILSNSVVGGLAAGDNKYQKDEMRITDVILTMMRALCPVMKPKLQSRTGSLGIDVGGVSWTNFKFCKVWLLDQGKSILQLCNYRSV